MILYDISTIFISQNFNKIYLERKNTNNHCFQAKPDIHALFDTDIKALLRSFNGQK